MPTILVADDNSNIQKMVSLAFQERGIRVIAVGNGEAACRKVPEVRPDLVLADVFMPVRNGYEVCEFVKRDPEFSETPVILLVGAFDPLDEKEAARVGANGVLKKPFVPPDPLISMVSSLLGTMEAPAEEPQAASAEQVAGEAPKIEYTTPLPVQGRPPQEFAFGSDGKDDLAGVFGQPVAEPAAENRDAADVQEEDADPESEWARRRATVEYEIDPADSHQLVEKLAEEANSTDSGGAQPEIMASNKHLPFGGANFPTPSSDETLATWMDFQRGEEAAEIPLDQNPAAEMTAGKSSDSEVPSTEKASSEFTAGADYAESVSQSKFETETLPGSTQSYVSTPEPLEMWPEKSPEPAAGTSTNRFAPLIGDAEEQKAPESQSVFSPESAVPTGTETQAARPLPETHSVGLPPAIRAQTDAALVDDVVARVISKLEPQLHQALANGVLRPLVEEVLNEKREKK